MSAQFQRAEFLFSTPVWGAGHIATFLEIGLPSLLSPGNLPALRDPDACRFFVYTRPEDVALIEAADCYRRLTGVVPTEIVTIEETITVPHMTMSRCHLDTMRRADQQGKAAVFLPPDCIWSDGSMKRLEELACAGYSAVHISGIRLDRDMFKERLGPFYSEANQVLKVPARTLVREGLTSLHPIAFLHFWNEHGGGLMPANLMWSVGEEGLLLRCFHLHPLMVKSQVRFASFGSTIDDDLCLVACPDASKDYVVQDSDELFAFEMSDLHRIVGSVCEKGSVEGVAAWAEYGANERHRRLIRNPIRVHSGDRTADLWSAVERESNRVVDRILALGRKSLFALMTESPRVFSGRAYAVALGRGQVTTQGFWLLGVMLKCYRKLRDINRAIYGFTFVRNGRRTMSHPYWLIAKSITAAVDPLISRDVSRALLAGIDEQTVADIRANHPGADIGIVEPAFPGSDRAVGVPQADTADLLVAVKTPLSKPELPVLNDRIARRQVLLTTGPEAPVPGFDRTLRFGGLGTIMLAQLYEHVYIRAFSRLRRASLLYLLIKLPVFFVAALLYPLLALFGLVLTGVGLLMDAVDKRLRPPTAVSSEKADGSQPRQ